MARTEARILSSVWNDSDFRSLTSNAQWLYWALLSQPELSMCGVLTDATTRWAHLAADLTPRTVSKALAELVAGRFLVNDPVTSELFLRAYLRRDGVLKKPNMIVAMARAFGAVHSSTIREAILCELTREFGDNVNDGLRQRFPKPFPEGFNERFPQGFRDAVHAHALARARVTKSPSHHHHHITETVPPEPVHQPTPPPPTPATEPPARNPDDDHQELNPNNPTHIDQLLDQTWQRLAEHDLRQYLTTDHTHRVGNRTAWLRTAATARRQQHEDRARAELANRRQLPTPIDLAELLDPSCGPDDGGAARARAAAEETAARAQAEQDRVDELASWARMAEERLQSLPADERASIDERAEELVPAGAPLRDRVVHARRLQLVMGELPDDVGEVG